MGASMSPETSRIRQGDCSLVREVPSTRHIRPFCPIPTSCRQSPQRDLVRDAMTRKSKTEQEYPLETWSNIEVQEVLSQEEFRAP